LADSRKNAVLLLAHGSPDSVEEVPDFLLRVTGGRPLPQPVVDEVKHRYGLIGRSPLTELTLKQAELLARELGMPVYVGMRNWKPFIADAVRALVSDGIEHAVESAWRHRIRGPAWVFTALISPATRDRPLPSIS